MAETPLTVEGLLRALSASSRPGQVGHLHLVDLMALAAELRKLIPPPAKAEPKPQAEARPNMGQVMAECGCPIPTACLRVEQCIAEERQKAKRDLIFCPGPDYYGAVAELDRVVDRIVKAGFRGTINHTFGELTIR